jgi:hypothetical protein
MAGCSHHKLLLQRQLIHRFCAFFHNIWISGYPTSSTSGANGRTRPPPVGIVGDQWSPSSRLISGGPYPVHVYIGEYNVTYSQIESFFPFLNDLGHYPQLYIYMGVPTICRSRITSLIQTSSSESLILNCNAGELHHTRVDSSGMYWSRPHC